MSTPEPAVAERRPITGGAVMSGASRVTVAAAGALTSIIVARILGTDGSGAYALATTLVLVLTILSTLGVEHGVAYYVTSGRWAPRKAVRESQLVALLAGLVAMLAAIGLRLLVPSAFGGLSVGMVAVLGAVIPFAVSVLYLTFVALAVDAYEDYVAPPAVQAVTMAVGVAVLGALFGVWGVVLGVAGSYLLTWVFAAARARRWLSRTAAGPPAESRLGEAITFGVKGYAANVLQLVNYRLDVFVLSAAAGVSEVGIYSVAVALTGLLWLLPPALSDVLFPRVASLSAAGGEEQRAMVESKALRHVTVVVLASAVGVVVLLVGLVIPIYGTAFRSAIGFGLIMLPGAALLGIGSVLAAVVVGRGFPQYSLYVALTVAPLTIVLYLVLIPPLSGTGAALASSISYTATFVGLLIAFHRATGRSALPALVPTHEEWRDYRALPAAVAAKGRATLGRRSS